MFVIKILSFIERLITNYRISLHICLSINPTMLHHGKVVEYEKQKYKMKQKFRLYMRGCCNWNWSRGQYKDTSNRYKNFMFIDKLQFY